MDNTALWGTVNRERESVVLHSSTVINRCGDLQMLVNEAAKTGIFFVSFLLFYTYFLSGEQCSPMAECPLA